MRKRFFSLLLAVVLSVSVLVVPASAETADFSDLTDQNTASAVEILRLMGVLSGYGDGTFRPNTVLNRAQFCKMAVYAMDASDGLGQYRTVTIFPDVKPSHWAAAYINMAAKGKGVISGYADGKFYPDKTVTVGQAVTILLRILGYKDEKIGGVWPDSYMAVGETIGLTYGVGTNCSAPLTRAQAAKLFLNMLQVKGEDGSTLYDFSKETDLLAIDGGSGEMKTSDGVYTMVHPVASSALVGSRGKVVLNGKGEALTFLPSSGGKTNVTGGAVIVSADRSTAGFEALAGNNTYTIYKNGQKATAPDLRKGDVAIYNAATNSIRVCDTRIGVYYENCSPNPQNPTRITALGHEFAVLPSAQASVAAFRPGDRMVLLLTADGQVAGATTLNDASARSNMLAVVYDGKVQLLCGGAFLPLEGLTAPESFEGKAVRVSSDSKGGVTFSAQSGGVSGTPDLKANTLGGKTLAENLLVFNNGQVTGKQQLEQLLYQGRKITYAHTNWRGDVDLIILARSTDEIFGLVKTTKTQVAEDEWDETLSVDAGGQVYGPYGMYYSDAGHGDFAALVLNREGKVINALKKLTELKNVSFSSWLSDSAVTFGGKTYTIPADVLCYNRDTAEWIDLDTARAYSNTANLHAKDGIVRIVEVGG